MEKLERRHWQRSSQEQDTNAPCAIIASSQKTSLAATLT